MDNFYTSLVVMTFVWSVYGMLMVGRFKLTSTKKSWTGADFPYHKLSNGALDLTHCGWMWTAVKEVKPTNASKFVVQATVWRDKKEVAFLHNFLVKPSHNHETRCQVKGQAEPITTVASP